MLEDRDNGADIRTVFSLYQEDTNSLLCLPPGRAWAILDGVLKWVADGECDDNIELTDGEWRIFNTLVDKHEKRVKEHRANIEKQRARAQARWAKARG